MNEFTTLLRCPHHPDSAPCTSGCLVYARSVNRTAAVTSLRADRG